MKAGPNGWRGFEVYSPVRLDHLALAGQKVDGASATFPDQDATPSLQPGDGRDVSRFWGGRPCAVPAGLDNLSGQTDYPRYRLSIIDLVSSLAMREDTSLQR
jgi:hypothetical protein